MIVRLVESTTKRLPTPREPHARRRRRALVPRVPYAKTDYDATHHTLYRPEEATHG